MEIEVSEGGEERTFVVRAKVAEGDPVTLQYGGIGGSAWLLVIGDPLTASERKLNIVSSAPLLAVHKDDAALLMRGQKLEKEMTFYTKRSRLPKESSEADYLYVWLLGARAAKEVANKKLIPWSDSQSAAPLLVHVTGSSFKRMSQDEDKGKVTMGKGSQAASGDLADFAEDGSFTTKGNGQFVVLLTDADGNQEFQVVNVGKPWKPSEKELEDLRERRRNAKAKKEEEEEPEVERITLVERPTLPPMWW